MVRQYLDNQQEPVWRLLGMPTLVGNPARPASTNLSVLGFSAPLDNATAATKKGVFAAIPVSEGDSIANVSVLIGGTEGKTGVKSFVAVYSGTTAKKEAKLLGQSKVKEVAIKPGLVLTEALEASFLVNSETAPNGYVFAGLIVEATTINTQIGTKVPTAAQKSWFAKSPEALAIEVTQKEAGVAAETVKTETAIELVPFVVLT